MGGLAVVGTSRQNRCSDTFWICANLGVPEPEHGPTKPLQKCRSFSVVVCGIEMLAAIQFHCDPV